jgi:hypothetical protein
LPGFYYDPIKQKYFKIESNSYGINSIISKHSIKKQNIEKLNKSWKASKNLLCTLFETQLNGSNQKVQHELHDHLLKTAKSIQIFDLSRYPKFKQLQSFQINDKNYFLVNFTDDLFNHNCCLIKFDQKDLEFKCHNVRINVLSLYYFEIKFFFD